MALLAIEKEKEKDDYILKVDQLYYLRRISTSLFGNEIDYPPSTILEMGRQHAENKKRAASKK